MKAIQITSKEGSYWKTSDVEFQETDVYDLEFTGEIKQKILGFGGCFNELGWEALQIAKPEQKEKFLNELFNQDNCNFNYGRIPIGANDFSKEWYSCCEVDKDYKLEHFNIDRDKIYTIPFVREAVKRFPDFTLFASPWSPPTWMKTHKAYNYGRIIIDDKILQSYALYFVKFIQAYEKEGINISQIHVQNEPMADQKFPSCLWNGEDMRIFIRDFLGPALTTAGLDAELWLGTINGPFNDFMMGSNYSLGEYYDQFANTVLSDSNAKKHITGVGVQWGGKHVLEEIESSYPELRYMQTESECGDGKNNWTHMEYIFRQMWFYFKHGIERYTYWNMALLEGGISTWGWSQNSLCTVNPETGELTLQPEFYLMKHLSHFIKKGAKVLETKGRLSSNCITFQNPDNSIIIVAGNNMNEDRKCFFRLNNNSFSAVLKAHSINTFKIN